MGSGGGIGGSNGGLQIGATLTQRPQLMRAVVSKVGIYDMLRTNANTGDGASLDARIDEGVDVLAFLLSQVGVEFR